MIRQQALPRGRQAWNLKTKRPWRTSDVTDKMVVAAYAEYGRERDGGVSRPLYPHFRLMVAVGAPEKVCTAAIKRSHRRGFISYGVSLRTGWVTDAGVALFFPPTQGTA